MNPLLTMYRMGQSNLLRMMSTYLSTSSVYTVSTNPSAPAVSRGSASTSTHQSSASGVSSTSSSDAGAVCSSKSSHSSIPATTEQNKMERTPDALGVDLTSLVSRISQGNYKLPQLEPLMEARQNLMVLDSMVRRKLAGEQVDELRMKRLRLSIEEFINSLQL